MNWQLFTLCLPLGLILGTLVFGRIVASWFSKRIAQSVQATAKLHCLLLALSVILMFVGCNSSQLPPNWVERISQRKTVFKKVAEGGGWDEFNAECDFLIRYARTNEVYQWFPGFNKPMPASCKVISLLRPHYVDVVAPGDRPAYVAIKLFGMHSTGGRDTPYYGLLYQQITNATQQQSPHGQNHQPKGKKITESVFELY